MKKMRITIIITLSCLIILFAYNLVTAFDPVYDKAIINQNIGGTLICNAEFIPDIHSSPNTISYLYKYNGTIIDLGLGSYTKRQWKKDEQIIKLDNWLILKTGGDFESDKLIIGNIHLSKWNEYEFTPDNIEKEELWKAKNINSLLNYCCAETYINKIKDGVIELNYKYRTSEKQSEKYEVRKIYYKIENKTGKPTLIKVN